MRAPAATPPADVFTKRQFHKDNYEICEKTATAMANGGEGGKRPSILSSFLIVPALIIAIKFAVYRCPRSFG